MQQSPFWHTLSLPETLAQLSVGPTGLSSEEAVRRLAEQGPNELTAAGRVSPWSVLASQFKNVLIVILLIATGISAFLGHAIESIAIAAIVLFAILLGFIQEYRAERAIEALQKMTAPEARVLRDGRELRIPARDLVAGDLILLKVGDKVPGDARVMESANLRADEASLSGESVPVEKHDAALAEAALVIGDRSNMVYSGTSVTYGRGRAVVVATGMDTEFGRITGMLESVQDTRTPLQENLDRVGRALVIVALAVVSVIVILGMVRGAPLIEMFVFGVALAVAVVPEALPAVVTISLALGVQRMAKRNALMRHLPAVETLGSTSVICSDKTGTLTRDEMTVRRLWVDGRWIETSGTGYEPHGRFLRDGVEIPVSEPLSELLRGAALACDARLRETEDNWKIDGDPTEGALVVLAAKAGLDKAALEAELPRVDEIAFSSERKRMTTLHQSPQTTIAYSKGAPEVIATSCAQQQSAHGLRPLDPKAVSEAARVMAGDALRVLAIARKADARVDDAERDMVFLGLVGMIDPPRPEAARAIQTCADAGIRPIMITGDHPATGEAVARELGLLRGGRVVTGADLETMSDAELHGAVENIDVYARVSPAHKLRVVSAWQGNGHIVAMTGDGVNDAPALKKADVGVAMGITGTDVSREAADMTLTDDNFASIVGAVEEGRGLFSNIKKYLMYLLSSNIGEIGLMAGAVLAGLPLPLTAVQILYVNLATDGLPALALSVDPPEQNLMRRPPRDRHRGIFTRPVVLLMLVGGAWSTTVNLALFTWALGSGRNVEQAMALTFISLVLIQLTKAYNLRSERYSILDNPFANRWLNLAVVWELVLLTVIVYLPILHVPFGTYALSSLEWAIVVGIALSVIPVLETAKWIVRRGWLGETI